MPPKTKQEGGQVALYKCLDSCYKKATGGQKSRLYKETRGEDQEPLSLRGKEEKQKVNQKKFRADLSYKGQLN